MNSADVEVFFLEQSLTGGLRASPTGTRVNFHKYFDGIQVRWPLKLKMTHAEIDSGI